MPNEKLQSGPQNFGTVKPCCDRYTFRQEALLLFHIALYSVCHIQGALVTNAKHIDHDRFLSIKARNHIRVLKAVNDCGNITQVYIGPITAGQNRDPFKLGAHIPLSFGTHQDFPA